MKYRFHSHKKSSIPFVLAPKGILIGGYFLFVAVPDFE